MDTCEAARLLATATITDVPALIVGVLFATDGTNAPVLSIYDNTDATDATKKIIPPVTGLTSSTQWVGFFPNMPIKCRIGIHVVIGGTIGAGEVMVYWRPQ
jgi:hypothetical protein